MLKILKQLNLIIVLFLLFAFALPGSAATLYFDPAVGSLGPGNVFALDVLLNVEDCVNAIEADISFPYQDMQLQDFIIGESVLSIWLEQPNRDDIELANTTGILNFVGGVPGGYCGQIPGDPGNSNTVARLIFSVNNNDDLEADKSKINILFLPSTKVLLNDGLGARDVLTTKTASFNHVNEKVDISNDWLKQIDGDIIAPEPFIVELRQNSNMFNNQYYIIFSTTDKQSGMDHFEVLEIRHDQELGVVKESFWDKLRGGLAFVPEWKIAEIPYLLNDQDLLSTIRVKAIDKAGNERFVEYIPPGSRIANSIEWSKQEWIIFSGLAILVLVFSGLLIIFIRRIIINKKYDKE